MKLGQLGRFLKANGLKVEIEVLPEKPLFLVALSSTGQRAIAAAPDLDDALVKAMSNFRPVSAERS